MVLPEGARERLWEALGPSLREPIGADVEELLTRFCERHQVADGELARVIKACRFLLRGAAMLDLPRERFAADLVQLLGEEEAEATRALLLPGYERAKVFVRGELLRRTLDAYEGKLVEHIDWRLEHIVCSSHGDNLDVRLGALTFRYREGDAQGRITLHLGREALEELARACARMLERHDRGE